jgi:hypothetical protein
MVYSFAGYLVLSSRIRPSFFSLHTPEINITLDIGGTWVDFTCLFIRADVMAFVELVRTLGNFSSG